MQHQKTWIRCGFLSLVLLLTACGSVESKPVQVVKEYLNAIVSLDSVKIQTIACADWADQALMEVDSFQSVSPKLEGLSCQESGKDSDAVLVSCQGKILATYNNEQQEFPLDTRIFRVVKTGSDYQVCGYQ